MYFMAVSGLRNGIELQTHPFALSLAKPFGTFYSQAWNYLEGDFLRTGLIIASSVAGILIFGMSSAYAFARMEFLARGFLFYTIFGLLLIPSFLTLITCWATRCRSSCPTSPAGRPSRSSCSARRYVTSLRSSLRQHGSTEPAT
jgi:ABC-type glycerol-3-phosphate transport system permease component